MPCLSDADHVTAHFWLTSDSSLAFAGQEAKLQQLSIDLKSELTSGSLTELKQMVSDFMQQLKDSMSRQAQMPLQVLHPTLGSPSASLPNHSSSPNPVGLPAHPIPQFAPSEFPVSTHAAEGAVSQMPPKPDLSNTHVPTDSIIRPSGQTSGGQEQNAVSNITPHSDSMQKAASVLLSEDEIELDLPESQATSVIEEEFGLAGSGAAESVAESVSDFQ